MLDMCSQPIAKKHTQIKLQSYVSAPIQHCSQVLTVLKYQEIMHYNIHRIPFEEFSTVFFGTFQ